MKEYVYKKTEQKDLKLLVHTPDGWAAGDRRPAIVFFFGGAWVQGSPQQFLGQAEYFARRGMVAVRVDYRVKITPIVCLEDAKSSIRWLRAHAGELGIDPGRIVASGGSAGAQLAIAAAIPGSPDAKEDDRKHSARPDVLVLFNPPLNMQTEAFAKMLTSEEKTSVSPLHHVAKDLPPIILFYGVQDPFYKQGQEFLAASRKVGARAVLYSAAGRGHGFFNEAPWKDITLREADLFLIAHKILGGEPAIKETKGALTREE